MNNSEILKLIKVKELEIKKLQLEIDELKKQFNEITTNSSEDILSREDSVKIFMNYFNTFERRCILLWLRKGKNLRGIL